MTEQSHPKDGSPNALPSDGLVPLESILCTEELSRRPSRPPEYEKENCALTALVQAMTDSPRTILQTLADKILEVFGADSAGISLLTKEDGGKRFYWPAIAGVWKPHIGGGTPRDFGPCGDVLDRNVPLLFRHFERRYAYFLPVTPPVEECLLVPFYIEGKAVGTIWAIAHDERRKFDAEDLRQLESLGRFASAAYQAVEFLDVLEQRGKALQQSQIRLAERMTELRKTDTKSQDARRAALNLMEDAVQSRQAMERLNAELRESEERFRSLVSVITDVPWTTDSEGRFITPQAAWETYTGQNWEEHRGSGWANVIHPEDRERVKAIWMDASASRNLYHSEGRLWHAPTQRWRYFIAKATPLQNTDGSVREWVGTCIDCDDQRRVEENLEKVVVERTAALQRTIEEREQLQDQLLQAQKMESVGTLASGVAHDFNNLLNIISGYTASIRMNSKNLAAVAEGVNVIEETVKRGTSLVRQLLILGRKGETKFATLTLNSIIANLAGLLEETFSKTIGITLNLEHGLPLINGNENQLRQILLNLCVNAREAMPQGGRISIKTETVPRDELRARIPEVVAERYVSINVSDTGIGMEDTTQARIFEPFFTTKPEGQGTGLGLAVVYGIVKNHSGFIEVKSEIGSGTTFCIYLPVPDVTAEQTSEAGPIAATPKSRSRGETILFVDDEEHQLVLMQRILEREGYKFLGATDGMEAVEIFSRHKDEIAVAVMDLGLPRLNGWQAFRRMREIRPSLKALIATGFAPVEVTAEIAQESLGDVIAKPYNLNEILEKSRA
jgi:PAS domain S-box-containing protein